MIGEIHSVWGWVAIGIAGAVGLWGVVLGLAGKQPGRPFYVGLGVGVTAMLAQVAMGVYSFAVEGIQPGTQHVFYGVVITFTFAFAYIYRVQFRRRPALYLGLLMLFVMGLGIRGVLTFGNSF